MRAAETQHGLYLRDMPEPSTYRDMRPDCEKWAQQEVDRRVWEYLLGASGLKNLMDAEAVDSFRKQLRDKPPECTMENINATFSQMNENKAETFVRGLINVFHKLDWEKYKTNDAFKIQPKIIMSNIMSCWGSFNHWNNGGERIGDLCRIFHILDGREPRDHLGDFRAVIASAWRDSNHKPTECESEYFHARLFKNGNVHLSFKRKDLVTKANRLIAEHYGQTLAAA